MYRKIHALIFYILKYACRMSRARVLVLVLVLLLVRVGVRVRARECLELVRTTCFLNDKNILCHQFLGYG